MNFTIGFFFKTTFLDKYTSFAKYSKQNLIIAESSRSLSRNKKKVKHSKLAGAATNETSNMNRKNNFLSTQVYQIMLAGKRYN